MGRFLNSLVFEIQFNNYLMLKKCLTGIKFKNQADFSYIQ